MDSLSGRCPDDIDLEAYMYGDLPGLKVLRVRLHLMFCATCRMRLQSLRRFSEALSSMPLEEPPPELLDGLVSSIDGWGAPTPAAPGEEDRSHEVRGPELKLRWALGAVFFVISTVLQWQYGEYLPQYLSGSYIWTLKGLQSAWEFVVSGSLWDYFAEVVSAIRTDGFSALRILGRALPAQVAGVIVFGGIVTAVFISQLKGMRQKGENHK